MDENDNVLAHFGVAGMRWGVRKGVSSGGSSKSAKATARTNAKIEKTRSKMTTKVSQNQEAKSKKISKLKTQSKVAALKGNEKKADRKATYAKTIGGVKRQEAQTYAGLMKSKKGMKEYMKNTKKSNIKKATIQVGITAAAAAVGFLVVTIPLPRDKTQNYYSYKKA